MAAYSKYNIVYRLQKWMDTVSGQTFLNYAYSWGASVVILGALFKLTHLPGANIMLFIGMGTEVFVFFISAFDRPFDKTADGREMPTRLTEEFLETGKVRYSNGEEAGGESDAIEQTVEHAETTGTSAQEPRTIIISGVGQQPAAAVSQQSGTAANPQQAETDSQQPTAAVQPNFVPQMTEEEAKALNEAQGSYVEELKTLVETLKKVNEQSTRLTRDSEEMENLNRTLTGISKIYEMQLKGASQQIGTIDEINAQTRKMAEQIDQLNHIYARMIEAMTVNMRAATPQTPAQ